MEVERKWKLGQIVTTIVLLGLLIMGVLKVLDLILPNTKKYELSMSEFVVLKGDEVSYRAKGEINYDVPYMDGFRYIEELGIDRDEQEIIYLLSKDYGISYTLVLGLIDVESGFQNDIISETGDYGLFQVNKINHGRLTEILGVEDFLGSTENIRAGMYILADLFDKYEDTAKVLMAYNMGEAGASSLWAKGIYETDYVVKVFQSKESFDRLLNVN